MRRHQRQLPFKPTIPGDFPAFAEFFAGIGLVRLGLEQAGWRVAFANDIDARKFAAYDGHFGDGSEHFRVSDIREISSEEVPDIQLATASFPCTDLSIAGGRRGIHQGESSAFWAFVELLSGMRLRRPPLILLENVTGFLTSHGGDDFRSAMSALSDLGYAVDAFILDARWFVPQSRPRLFIVGRQGVVERSSFVPTPTRIRPAPLVSMIEQTHDSICWNIRDLPDPPRKCDFDLAAILQTLPDDDPAWWSDTRSNYLLNQMSDRHRAVADEMIAGREWSYGTVFRRVRRQPNGEKRSMAELRTDGIAGCLRTPKGGSGRQILFQAGFGQHRARLLTPIECARLMGANSFRIRGSLNDALFGFGDAVCVPAITWIAQNYLNPCLEELDRDRCVAGTA